MDLLRAVRKDLYLVAVKIGRRFFRRGDALLRMLHEIFRKRMARVIGKSRTDLCDRALFRFQKNQFGGGRKFQIGRNVRKFQPDATALVYLPEIEEHFAPAVRRSDLADLFKVFSAFGIGDIHGQKSRIAAAGIRILARGVNDPPDLRAAAEGNREMVDKVGAVRAARLPKGGKISVKRFVRRIAVRSAVIAPVRRVFRDINALSLRRRFIPVSG